MIVDLHAPLPIKPYLTSVESPHTRMISSRTYPITPFPPVVANAVIALALTLILSHSPADRPGRVSNRGVEACKPVGLGKMSGRISTVRAPSGRLSGSPTKSRRRFDIRLIFPSGRGSPGKFVREVSNVKKEATIVRRVLLGDSDWIARQISAYFLALDCEPSRCMMIRCIQAAKKDRGGIVVVGVDISGKRFRVVIREKSGRRGSISGSPKPGDYPYSATFTAGLGP